MRRVALFFAFLVVASPNAAMEEPVSVFSKSQYNTKHVSQLVEEEKGKDYFLLSDKLSIKSNISGKNTVKLTNHSVTSLRGFFRQIIRIFIFSCMFQHLYAQDTLAENQGELVACQYSNTGKLLTCGFSSHPLEALCKEIKEPITIKLDHNKYDCLAEVFNDIKPYRLNGIYSEIGMLGYCICTRVLKETGYVDNDKMLCSYKQYKIFAKFDKNEIDTGKFEIDKKCEPYACSIATFSPYSQRATGDCEAVVYGTMSITYKRRDGTLHNDIFPGDFKVFKKHLCYEPSDDGKYYAKVDMDVINHRCNNMHVLYRKNYRIDIPLTVTDPRLPGFWVHDDCIHQSWGARKIVVNDPKPCGEDRQLALNDFVIYSKKFDTASTLHRTKSNTGWLWYVYIRPDGTEYSGPFVSPTCSQQRPQDIEGMGLCASCSSSPP